MKAKVEALKKRLEKEENLSEEERSAILQKIKEWEAEDAAIGDLMNHLREYWIKIEPIFAEMGLV